MYQNFQIISDGSCDLAPKLAQEKNIIVIPFYVSFDSVNYLKEAVEITEDEFYNTMTENPKLFPKSSLPAIQDYVNAFRPFAEEGTPVLCICITTKFSGSYNSAINARDILLEDYPDARIEVIDSTVNTCLQGLLVLEAARMQADGFEFDEVVKRINTLRPSGRIFFTIGSIDYLAHGGRIGKLAGLAASTLGLRPLIQLKEGEIFSGGISRSRKKSLTKVLLQVREHFDKIQESVDSYQFTIGYGHNIEEALAFRNELVTLFNGKLQPEDIPLSRIGATIAVHTGPEALGVGLIRRYDSYVAQPAVSGIKRLYAAATVPRREII